MLIRSQDKRMIANFDNICTVSAFPEKDSEDIYVEDGTGSLMVGRYSTKEKAIKVLDMIQEAYADAELIPMAVSNIGKMFAEVPASKENELLAEGIGKALMNKMVFQMPEDGSVEV
uniref:Uncharacterized protein n=1 Tax=Siphoviridae sp. ctv0N24 TaxID=2826509 RepID=A0A8S5N446_9CAUD|nr:MAG TPA: hypothetical protein [Siphoviridae sp. ctv0N24]